MSVAPFSKPGTQPCRVELDQIGAELEGLSNRLLALMEALPDNRDAQLALDSARHGLSRSRHDLLRAKTRISEAAAPAPELPPALLEGGAAPANDLPPGACTDCDGEGEQGGQFCGYWPCETCGGTGKAPPTA